MKALRKLIDNIKPQYEKGGKYEKYLPLFESFETFLYVLSNTTKRGVHVRDNNDLKRTMIIVVFALIPVLLMGAYNVGYQHNLAMGITDSTLIATFFYGFIRVLPLIIVSYGVGLGVEFIFVVIKGHEVHEGFLVSGMLIPLIVPIDIPLWMVAVATAFAVLFAKEAFGGTGMNVFNVALVARAFLFFAYPSKMSGDVIWIRGAAKGAGLPDGFSGATILGQAASGNTHFVDGVGNAITSSDMFFGFIPGSIGETSTFAILIGAVLLVVTGIASWKIITSVFAGGLLTGLLFNAVGAGNAFMEMPAYYHLIIGGFAFGAVFMATDPVTAARSEKAKWIYGLLIGILAVLFRVVNPAYPEGMMLAILIMNIFAPLLDYYVVQGHISKRLKRAKVKA